MNTDIAALLAFFAVLQLAGLVMLLRKRLYAMTAGYVALLAIAWPASVIGFNAGLLIVGHVLWLIPVVCVIFCARMVTQPK